MDSQPSSECLPIATLPKTSALFRDYTEASAAGGLSGGQDGVKDATALRRWYPTDPFDMGWAARSPVLAVEHRGRLADALQVDQQEFGAGAVARANVEKLRNGAAAVVTGQQVGLFGGPLLTLLKAATAVRKAADATRVSGREHVPVFWLATEDHDLAEVDQVALPTKNSVETLRLGVTSERPVPVGGLSVGEVGAALEQASELLGWAPIAEVLGECYGPERRV